VDGAFFEFMEIVKQSNWPNKEHWPKPGFKHALNSREFRSGDVFGWNEGGHLWTGIVEETGTCCVKVRDVMPGVLKG
jgi:hypothetical protein